MATSVNNWSVKVSRGHTPNEKRAHFLDFYKSEGAPCPSAPPPCSAAHGLVHAGSRRKRKVSNNYE